MKNNNIPMYQLSQEKALKFDIIQKLDPKNKGLIEFKFLKVEERKYGFIISIALWTGEEKKLKNIVYLEKDADPYKATFLGWALLCCKREDSYREKAKNLFGWAIYREIDSCFPIYLLAKGGFLETRGMDFDFIFYNRRDSIFEEPPLRYSGRFKPFPYLLDALEKPDIFPNFYFLFDEFPVNEIKMEVILKEAWEKFPNDGRIFLRYAKYLSKSEMGLKERLEVFKKSKPWNEFDLQSFDGAFDLEDMPKESVAQELKIRFLFGDYEGALEIIGGADHPQELKEFLLGIVEYEQKKYIRAIYHFEEAIKKDKKESEITQASLYYLLACYKTDFASNKRNIEHTIDSIKLEQNLFGLSAIAMSYVEVAEEALSDLLEKDIADEFKCKAKGLITYAAQVEFYDMNIAEQREVMGRNRIQLDRVIGMAKDAAECYPRSILFNRLCSNLFCIDEKYDEAMKYALATLNSDMGTDERGIYVNLKDCSEDFLERYVVFLSKELDKGRGAIVEYLISHLLSDLEVLFDRKKYDSIINLYNYLNELEGVSLKERLSQEYYRYLISYEKILPILESSLKLAEDAQNAQQEEKNKDEKDSIKKEEEYEYDEENEKGLLKIDGFRINFPDEERALIIKYFFEYRNVDTYRTYNDFEKKFPKIIKNSDTFSKKVKSINNEVRKVTDERIPEIIKQNKDIKAPKQNNFKWSVMRMY